MPISSVVVVLGALVGGVALLGLAADSTHRSSLACRRDSGRALCELRKVYPGSIVTTDRVELSSVAVDTRSYVLRGSSRSYKILVLNSDLDVPGGGDPDVLAGDLNGLLDGKTTAVPPIQLREPSYRVALILLVLGALLTGIGALGLVLLVAGPKRAARIRTADADARR